MRCEICKIRIPANRPVLYCSSCKLPKHYKCNKLSKVQAYQIIENHVNDWKCIECVKPIDQTQSSSLVCPEQEPHGSTLNICSGCSNPCSPFDYQTCDWCNGSCHPKCYRNNLGCITCCNDMIPGYNYESHQLTDSLLENSSPLVYTHYDPDSIMNSIGSRTGDVDEDQHWSEIYEHLNRCKYVPPTSNLTKILMYL